MAVSVQMRRNQKMKLTLFKTFPKLKPSRTLFNTEFQLLKVLLVQARPSFWLHLPRSSVSKKMPRKF